MKRSLRLGLTILALGCAPVQVTTQPVPGVDFSRYRTYAQAPPPAGADPAIRARVAREIDSVLLAKGFRAVPLDSADLVVVFRGSRQDRERLTDIGFPGSAQYVTENYVEGTLAIDVFARGGSRLWHGVGTIDVTSGSGLPDAAARAARAVLADFPPEPASGESRRP